jgi:hypothetical protein
MILSADSATQNPTGQALLWNVGMGKGIRVGEAFVSLTQPGRCGSRLFGRFGQEFFDVLVSIVALALSPYREDGVPFHASKFHCR